MALLPVPRAAPNGQAELHWSCASRNAVSCMKINVTGGTADLRAYLLGFDDFDVFMGGMRFTDKEVIILCAMSHRNVFTAQRIAQIISQLRGRPISLDSIRSKRYHLRRAGLTVRDVRQLQQTQAFENDQLRDLVGDTESDQLGEFPMTILGRGSKSQGIDKASDDWVEAEEDEGI
ncbi:MAG: hypothetical protein Q9162_002347 [Coniocarpon cinnabarinum]